MKKLFLVVAVVTSVVAQARPHFGHRGHHHGHFVRPHHHFHHFHRGHHHGHFGWGLAAGIVGAHLIDRLTYPRTEVVVAPSVVPAYTPPAVVAPPTYTVPSTAIQHPVVVTPPQTPVVTPRVEYPATSPVITRPVTIYPTEVKTGYWSSQIINGVPVETWVSY